MNDNAIIRCDGVLSGKAIANPNYYHVNAQVPFSKVRRCWFSRSAEGVSVEDAVRRLADEFIVTPAAMRVRLQQMKLVPT